MATHARVTRAKLSATVAPETYQFLEEMVNSGEAATISESIDRCVTKVREWRNRKRLARATSRYFDSLEPRAAAEENALAHDLSSAAEGIDFDQEL